MTPVKNLEDLVNLVNKLQEKNVPMDTQIVFTDSDYNYYDINFIKTVSGKESVINELDEETVDNMDNVPENIIIFYVDA